MSRIGKFGDEHFLAEGVFKIIEGLIELRFHKIWLLYGVARAEHIGIAQFSDVVLDSLVSHIFEKTLRGIIIKTVTETSDM